MNIEDLGITKEDLIEKATQKIAEEALSEDNPQDILSRIVYDKVKEITEQSLKDRIDKTLNDAMEQILGDEVIPRDIFGDKTGEPTTIRAALAERARVFWDTKVDNKGNIETYGGKPRSEHLMKSLLDGAFNKAIQENMDVVVAEFKVAMKKDLSSSINKHIDKIFPKGR